MFPAIDPSAVDGLAGRDAGEVREEKKRKKKTGGVRFFVFTYRVKTYFGPRAKPCRVI